MSSYEHPPAPPSPEQAHREWAEAFLECNENLRRLNTSLATVFDFVDALSPEEREDLLKHAEARAADETREEAGRGLAFGSRYGEHVVIAALERIKSASEENDAEKAQRAQVIADYNNFLLVLSEPELRPRLLSKMCYMDAGATKKEQVETWPERRAFNRFMTEFYGREKVFFRDEQGNEKGFLSLEGQVDLVQAWIINLELEKDPDFNEEAFRKIRQQIPYIQERLEVYDDEPLVAPVLTPYLPAEWNNANEVKTDGIQRTFEAHTKIMTACQELGRERPLIETRSDPQHLRLSEKNEHIPGLKVHIIDLGANYKKAPEQVQSSRSPHASILAAAALHWEWIQAMDGDNIPYVWMPGYRINDDFGDLGPWGGVPNVGSARNNSQVGLESHRRDASGLRLAVPEYRE